MAVSTLNFADRCGAVLISLSLIWMPTAGAHQLLARETDDGEDSSRLSEFVHNQSLALSALYVDLALAQSGQIMEAGSSRSKRQSVERQARALDQFLAKGDASRETGSAQWGFVKTSAGKTHNARRHRGLAAIDDAVTEEDAVLDLNACAAACARGEDGIARGDTGLADSMTLAALDKVRRFSARQIGIVLPALANIDDLLAARYFACDFPRHLAALTRDQSGFAPARLLAVAPRAVPAFNWQTTSIKPSLSLSERRFEIPTAVGQRHEQLRVARDARQLAWLYKIARQNAKAELWLRRVIPFYVDHLAEDPRALHDVYYELGELRLFQDDQGDAWEFYRQALAISALYPGVIPDPVWLLDRLAQTCVHLGKTDDSERFSRLALAATCAGQSVSPELNGLSLKDVLSLPAFKNVLNSESSSKVRGLLQTMIDQYWQAEQYTNVRLILEFLLGKAAADPQPLAIEKVAVSADTRKGAEEKNRMAMVQLGYLHLYDGDFQAGIDCFKHVLSAKQITVREKADYYAVLGQLRDDLGAAAEAEKDFRRAIHFYKIYCRNPHLEFEDREWVTDYIETLAWQNQIKNRVGHKNDYLKALDPHPWPQSPVKVFVCVEGETGFNQQTAAKLYAIFETWTKAVHGLVTCVRVPDYDSAEVTVERAGDHSIVASGSGGRTTYEYRFARPGESGQTVDWQPKNSKAVAPPLIVTKAHITLLCRLPNASELGPAGEERLFSLALHEAGHALGLDGHSPYGKDIMYWKSAQTVLSERDIASLSHLYAKRE